jgi:hypothetical protein
MQSRLTVCNPRPRSYSPMTPSFEVDETFRPFRAHSVHPFLPPERTLSTDSGGVSFSSGSHSLGLSTVSSGFISFLIRRCTESNVPRQLHQLTLHSIILSPLSVNSMQNKNLLTFNGRLFTCGIATQNWSKRTDIWSEITSNWRRNAQRFSEALALILLLKVTDTDCTD